MDKAVMTVKELSEKMRVSLPSAYAMTEQRGFPLVRVGKKKLIPVSAFERWLDKQASGQ